MPYREIALMEIDQVLRRWLAGDGIRAIARGTGLDRKTVRSILVIAKQQGLQPGVAWPGEEHLRAIHEQVGCPGASAGSGSAELTLLPQRQQIQSWLDQDRLLLTKVHELLQRQGLAASYSSLYRFARKWCGAGSSSSLTVRKAQSAPGELAEVDFGRLGLLHPLGSNGPRVVHGFIMILGYSRLSCVIPTFSQDLDSVIHCFEQAFEFFQGCTKRVVVDNLKACLDQADRYTPRLNRTFLEYAAFRGFLPDPARPYHAKDKPMVENHVRYVRERFFKGETFLDLDDVARRAKSWCRETAGGRIHGTTRCVPLEVFQAEEQTALIPLKPERFDTPRWAQCKVHPDHHVRFDHALYSVPTRWVGKSVDIRADRSLVRVYSGAELIKTHPRQRRGSRSTDYNDYPKERAAYALRYPDYYRGKAHELGVFVGAFADQLLQGEFPWSQLRQAQKLLALAERYGPARLDAACRRALEFELVNVHRLGRILEQAIESNSSSEPIKSSAVQTPLKFLRPATHFSHPTQSEGEPHADSE